MSDARKSPATETRQPAAKQIGVRVPADLQIQLEAIARREHNGVAAVCRRLITAALAAESDAA
jgi:hypothetical protein